MRILLFLSSYLVPVQFTEVPQNITVNASTPLFLSCDASGFPEPKIRWEKSEINLSNTKQLNISSSNRNDAGEYVCIASNGVRQEKTVRVYVTVQCKSLFQSVIKSCHCCWIHNTVEPISGHPVFSGQLLKSQLLFSLIAVVTFEWVTTTCLYCLPPVMNSLIERNHSIKTMIFLVKFNLCFSPEINVSNILTSFFLHKMINYGITWPFYHF